MSVCPNISDNSRAISREWDGVGGGVFAASKGWGLF